MPFLATRLSLIQPSPSVAAMSHAKALAAAGVDICNMTAGEPDFATPQHILEAAAQAMLDGATRYTAIAGTPELKQAIIAKFKRDNNLTYSPNQILVGTGAKQIIYNAFTCTIDEGDEVVVPAPYWVSYPDIVRLNGGTPVIVEAPASQGFKMTAQQLDAAISPLTKWVVINSPNNPTGAVYTEAELRSFGQVLRDHPHVHVLTDDIYEHLVYDERPYFSFAEVNPDLALRTLTVNGVSKAFAMTGFRIGYGAGSPELIQAMEKLQSQTTSNAAAVAQAAACAALNGPTNFFAEWRHEYQRRRDVIVSRLNGKAGLVCPTPEGAFYVYVSCDAHIGKKTPSGKTIADDNDFVMYLLDEYKVASVQGAAYGISSAFRLSFATSMEVIESACDRIIQACEALS